MGTYSHFGPRPLRMSWLTCCCCIAVIACGIGLFHMDRASSRPTSVQINTTKQFWLWGLAACLRPHMLKMRICVYTTHRLQGIVIDCKRNLQQDTRDCTKKMSVHILQVSPHIEIGCTPVRRTWEDHLSSKFHSEGYDEQAAITSLPVLKWLLLSPRAQRYFLTFKCGVPRAVRCTWTKWQWKLVHSPYQHPSAPCLRNYWIERVSYSIQHICRTRWVYPHRSHRAYHEFSTSVRWLSYVDIAWLVGVGQQLLFWGSRRSQVSPCLLFNMFTWHCYGKRIYPTPQVSPCLSNHTVAWHSWKCHGWWS